MITISYLTRPNPIWQELSLTLEDYFDVLQDDEETYSVRSLSKYNYPWSYIEPDLDELMCLRLKISIDNETIEENYTFWNNGANYILEQKNSRNNNSEDRLLIVLTEELENSHIVRNETLRFRKHKDFQNLWVPLGDIIELTEGRNGIGLDYKGVDKNGFSMLDYPL
jgi:hypothetical protein